MNLLIVTQKVDQNDENLGSVHRWLEEFAKHADTVTVITGFLGIVSLPSTISLYAYEKRGRGLLARVKRLWKFWELFAEHYRDADAVFFHMSPEFVLAASPFLLSRKKPSGLWYAHKSVPWKLKLAEKLVYYIFTASALSFRLPSKKVMYTGHAIDTEFFKPVSRSGENQGIRLLAIGRISPVKDLETVILACAFLKSTWQRNFSLSIVGGPLMPRDAEYLATLKKLVREKNLEQYVHFQGARPYTEVPLLYREHDLFISMSTTGSIDKAVLEAMSSGMTVVCGNEAFGELLPKQYFVERRTPEFLAERVKALADENRPNLTLRNIVQEHHGLEKTISNIILSLEGDT